MPLTPRHPESSRPTRPFESGGSDLLVGRRAATVCSDGPTAALRWAADPKQDAVSLLRPAEQQGSEDFLKANDDHDSEAGCRPDRKRRRYANSPDFHRGCWPLGKH